MKPATGINDSPGDILGKQQPHLGTRAHNLSLIKKQNGGLTFHKDAENFYDYEFL